jgi:hypothetical protein
MTKVAAIVTAVLFTIGSVDATHFQPSRKGDPYASLPAAIRDVVVRRGCHAPHRPDADSVTVVSGSFFQARGNKGASRDLAVMCMRKTKNEILVFRDKREKSLTALELWSGTSTIPGDSGETACDGAIGLVRAAEIADDVEAGALAIGDDSLDLAERRTPPHDGIVDGDCDGVSIVHYWTGRRWVSLPGGD